MGFHLMNHETNMKRTFRKTPLVNYFDSSPKPFSEICVAKLGVRLICECGLYVGVYSLL